MPPFVSVNVDRHGNERYYVRRDGKYLGRIRAEPNTEEFLRQYAAIVAGAPLQDNAPAASPEKSLKALYEGYIASGTYKTLSKGTRDNQRRLLGGLCKDYGHLPYAQLKREHVIAIMDKHADHPHAANNRLKALSAIFRWAVYAKKTTENPTAGVKKLRGRNPEGIHRWTETEVQQFEQRHPLGTKARLALNLLLYIGMRRSDVVKLGPQLERDGSIHFTETKGRERKVKRRVIPILAPLREAIDACSSGHLTYLVTSFGKPFTANGFGNKMREWCDEAGLPQCSAHGLRKAGATRAAQRGATDRQLMAMYGWTTPQQATTYVQEAEQEVMAAVAAGLIVTPIRPSVTKRSKKK